MAQAKQVGNLVRAMQESTEIFIEGFIDDALNQQGCFIDGKKIYSPNDLEIIIKKKDIQLILLALPSIETKKKNEIIRKLSKYNIAIRSIPNFRFSQREKFNYRFC